MPCRAAAVKIVRYSRAVPHPRSMDASSGENNGNYVLHTCTFEWVGMSINHDASTSDSTAEPMPGVALGQQSAHHGPLQILWI